MIDEKKVKEYIQIVHEAEKKQIDPIIEEYLEKIMNELGTDEDEIVEYLDKMSFCDIYSISGMFQDLSEKFMSKTFVDKMLKLGEKYKKPDMSNRAIWVDIEDMKYVIPNCDEYWPD